MGSIVFLGGCRDDFLNGFSQLLYGQSANRYVEDQLRVRGHVERITVYISQLKLRHRMQANGQNRHFQRYVGRFQYSVTSFIARVCIYSFANIYAFLDASDKFPNVTLDTKISIVNIPDPLFCS